MKKNNPFHWIPFVSGRFAKVDRQGRTAVTGALASAGIGFGVAALIIIISVMNGFQMTYIDSIMEISSFHIRATQNATETAFSSDELIEALSTVPGVRSVTEMYEAQGLIAGYKGRQSPGLLRGVPADICETDAGFAEQVVMTTGSFDLSERNSVILGNTLARKLGVHAGDQITLFALSGGSETALFDADRTLTVAGTFTSGYSDINSTFAFVSLETASSMLGSVKPFFGIKLKNSDNDQKMIAALEKTVPSLSYESWRSYNRSFFGALRVEKNILMMMSFLIFVVVGVNIFNSMRRMVYERHEEIAVLSSFGASQKDIQLVFMSQGLATGLKGAIPGLIAGLLISVNMDSVFSMFSNLIFYVQYFFTMLINPENSYMVRATNIYLYYARISARVVFSEAAAITLFGVLAALFASWMASRNVLKLSVAEVLHDE
ncbi:MAG: ABC transporter permease [Treponema sp.]|nr:ABC transporter permease [Candidatus Treponema caballi]